MLDLKTAQEQVLNLCKELKPIVVPLSDALGCVVAEKVIAKEEVPPFDNTAMDGFAIKSEDTQKSSTELKIIGDILAGDAPPTTELKTGEAYRIMTGAPIPKGADAIIQVEKTRINGTNGDTNSTNSKLVSFQTKVEEGAYIRRAGENIKKGQKLIVKGKILTPARLGVLASQGIYEILVYPKCKVGVLSTGNELTEGKKTPKKGKIRDSNRHILLSLIEDAGMEAIDLGIIKDTEKSIRKAIINSAKYCNAIITSGGVSMGDFDFVKKVLGEEEFNGSSIQIAIKPSKPLAFGRYENLMIFGLPGNPVSALVSFELFARPGLRKMMGFKTLQRPKIKAVAKSDVGRSPDGKTHFARVKAKFKNGQYEVKPIEAQGSHQLQGLAEANGLAILEDGNGAREGDEIDLILLN